MVARDDSAGGRASWPAYFTVFAIAMTIFLLAIPMMAVIKGYAGLARMCRQRNLPFRKTGGRKVFFYD